MGNHMISKKLKEIVESSLKHKFNIPSFNDSDF